MPEAHSGICHGHSDYWVCAFVILKQVALFLRGLYNWNKVDWPFQKKPSVITESWNWLSCDLISPSSTLSFWYLVNVNTFLQLAFLGILGDEKLAYLRHFEVAYPTHKRGIYLHLISFDDLPIQIVANCLVLEEFHFLSKNSSPIFFIQIDRPFSKSEFYRVIWESNEFRCHRGSLHFTCLAELQQHCEVHCIKELHLSQHGFD